MKKILLFVSVLFVLSSCNNSVLEDGPGVATETTGKEIVTLDSGILVEKLDGLYIYGGDIILSEHQLQLLDNMGTRAFVTNDFVKTWPNGVVYVDTSGYPVGSISNPTALQRAMQHWEIYTGITFVERTNQPDYVKVNVYNGMFSLSHLGRATGRQLLQITPNATVGEIIHLIGHTVGLMDEHSRPDRDNYILIHPENTIPGWDTLYFGINTEGYTYGDFDYNSIMLHSPYVYSFTGQPTMTKTDGTVWTQNTTRLSDRDIDALKYLYSEYTRQLDIYYLEGWDPVVKVGETRGIWAEYISPTCTDPRFDFSVAYPSGLIRPVASNVERIIFTFNAPGVHRFTATVINDIITVSSYINIDVQAVQNVYPQLVTRQTMSTPDDRNFTNVVKFWEDENFTVPLTNFERNHILIATKTRTTTYSSGREFTEVVEIVEDDLLQGPASDYPLSNTYYRTYLQFIEDGKIPFEWVVSVATEWSVEVATMILH